MRDAIQTGSRVSCRLLNYRKVRASYTFSCLFLTGSTGRYSLLELLDNRHSAALICSPRLTRITAPVKLVDGTIAKLIGVQVDVSRKTEGVCSAFSDGVLSRWSW